MSRKALTVAAIAVFVMVMLLPPVAGAAVAGAFVFAVAVTR